MQKAWTPVLLIMVCIVSLMMQFNRQEESLTLPDELYGDTKFISKSTLDHPTPSVLQFSCAVTISLYAEKLASQLEDGKGATQLEAAKELWRGRCRPHAESVLKFLDNSKSQDPDFRDFRHEAEASLKPDAIRKELKEGKYEWGTWLAYLRPHESLVPVLLEELKNEQRQRELPETLIALGKSNDRRVVEPLIHLLLSGDHFDVWAAATAIGLLEIEVPELEDHLLESLRGQKGLAVATISRLLGKVGTKKSLPQLQELTAIKYQGAINIKGTAESAIEKILQREMATSSANR